MRKLMIAAAALATVATPALAQTNTGSGNGLVAVNVQNVDILKNFLNGAQIAALDQVTGPITVQAPISVAAAVCPDVTAAVLAAQRKTGGASCTATSGSQALANIVNRQVLRQTK